MLGGVVQGLPDVLDLVLLGDRAHRANRRALPALHAGHGVQVVIEGRADDRFEAAVLREQRAHVLPFAADRHAAAALDALAVVAHQGRRGGVDPLAGLFAGEGDFADAQFGGQGLQLAVVVAVAGLALAVVLGEQQFHHQPPRVANAAAVGGDLHALGGGHGAGGGQVPRSLDFDDAHPARADVLHPFHVAERGNADPDRLGRLEDGRAFGNLDELVVDVQADHGLEFRCGFRRADR